MNGEMRVIPAETTLDELVRAWGGTLGALAVAVNDRVIPRGQLPQTFLRADDRVEIVRAVGGG